ncbi:hypothetical protein [Nocardia mexicana]|uniref:Uncharacterized protein n=1 Tax=Nocardia mexicana TaxID=279262 RepID=A0A370GXM9_9NOCA|nr:hypothetical protein [Nocardia mexicana]RDI48239.1 hypothetical protein DFR68_10868 [Nocardia mexicana]
MSAAAAWSVLLGLLAILGGVVYALLRSDDKYPREVSEAPSQHLEMVGWHHDAPHQPFTVKSAHQVMRQHKRCRREDCARKRAAWQTLVEARRITPDSGRMQ